MDNLTHAFAGLLLGEATVVLASRRAPVSAGFRRAALLLGVVAAELPDADLLYAGPVLGMGKLGYMLHHRGHTHTVVFALLGAALAWGVTMALGRGLRAAHARRDERWWLLALAVACTTVAHLALDGTNSYGVHPWWPLNDAWYYGDSVFIIEPWLWIAALPPLLLLAQRIGTRALYAVALAGIVAAAWRVGLVERGAAIALTFGAALMLGASWRIGGSRRHALVALGVGMWAMLEATFMMTSHVARAAIRDATGATYLDAAINPFIADPLCHDALVVERDGPTYRATRATVAPLPWVRSLASCARPTAGDGSRGATTSVRWREAWSAPVAELQVLARERCQIAAALRFIRVPAWERTPDGGASIRDLRFNRGGGFAELTVPARTTRCPSPIPPWIPPRAELLESE